MLIGYARVSTDDQDLALQLDALNEIGCNRIYQEKESGGKDDRAELQAALDYMREGDTLVVWRLDRLGRNLKHLIQVVEQLKQQGKHFRSVTEEINTGTATGTLVFHLFCALAEFERNLTRERVNAGLKAARARGRLGGRKRTITDKVIRQIGADLKANPDIPITQLCADHGISRASFYSVVMPKLKGCQSET